MANVLTVVAKLRAAKGMGDALAALLSEQAAAVRSAEPGCRGLVVFTAQPRIPSSSCSHEMYADDAASTSTVTRRTLPPTASVARRKR